MLLRVARTRETDCWCVFVFACISAVRHATEVGCDDKADDNSNNDDGEASFQLTRSLK